MPNSTPSNRILTWFVRVLAVVTVWAPTWTSGQEMTGLAVDHKAHQWSFPARTLPPQVIPNEGAHRSGAGACDEFPTDIADEVALHYSHVGGAESPCFWVVSSRGIPREDGGCDSSRLGYLAHYADGSLHYSSRSAMAAQFTPGVPICIFIHGSFVDVASHQRESVLTYNWIRRVAPHLPCHFIFYTWPSDALCNYIAPVNPIAVNQRGIWAERNALHLVDAIAHLPPSSPVCLVGHSHGCRVAAATLHLIAGGQATGKTYPYDTGRGRRYRAVFAAAALDRHWLNPGERYGCALDRSEGILNMINRADAALHVYPLRRPFLSRKAISVTGLTRWDRNRLGSVANKVIDYDVTPLVGLGHFWPNYYEEPAIALAISPYVYFTDSMLRPTYQLVTPSSAAVVNAGR